ncbi:MAG: chitobiase/beta-hexosaminidase C-terminal domain-containing protein [Bacteroidaceae bacterium]|nr:chitobiase/beta-hexosaminidase C-terminal domain-containing protein [Bacteroidaceae bacterium]
MKRTSTFFSLLAALLLLAGNSAWAVETWVKTAAADLQTGDVVAIVDLTSSLVLPSSNGSGAAPAATSVTLNSEKTEIDSEVADAWQWQVTVEDGNLQFNVPGTTNYLYCTNANNGVRVGTNENNVFSIAQHENGVDFLFNNATSRYIGPYNNQDWRCYTSVNNNIKDAVVVFFKKVISGVNVAKPVITPAGGAFIEPQQVSISAEEGCTVYYTLDGTEPTSESTRYTASFTVSTDCTVRAIAYDVAGNPSSVTSVEFTFLKPIATIAELCAAATDKDAPALVELNNWICTGVAGSNVYFTDGKNGILLYQSGHNFELNDVLTGKAQITLTTYNDCPEIKGLTNTTEGLTVTKGEGATPLAVTIGELRKDMQGNLITLEGVTYSKEGDVFIDDDDNEIIPYNRFTTLPELIDGKTYNATGVAIWYKNKQKWEIAPRTADEFQLLTSQKMPVSAWSVQSESVDVEGKPTARFTTDSDGEVTYESSDPSVATIDGEGNITPLKKGTTIITANVAETETYLPDSKSFKLTVTVDGFVDATFEYSDEDIQGQGAPNTGAELTATRNGVLTLFANKAYAKPGDNHMKIYGSKFEKGEEGEEPTLTEPSYIQLSVPEGYTITDIVLTATEDGYIKEWADQSGAAATIEGATATWSGEQTEVILTNQASSQARIKTIAVSYFDKNGDSITTITASAQADGTVYNLAGQRVKGMQQGIYIVGGKKIAVK